jgi:two-component system, NarL family, response regulator LiaR
MTIRILIVDDHSVVRQGLKMFLGLDPELQIIAEAADGLEAVNQTKEHNPDVILMDLMMPVMDGIEATRIIRRDFPSVEVIALTSVLEDALVIQAIKAGAIGYLLKDTKSDDLCRAVRAAARGQVQLAPQAAERLVREVQNPEKAEPLTVREQEVLRLLAHGKSNQEVASLLFISETTVKTHVSNILMKLKVASRTQAALYAVRTGLVSLEAPERLD